ncbi:hypothetical protein HYV10_00660 [Candidatus Dependentiae bacterium]|nr:hypothetical protein [Candidatus Dependentiae bacterium]
MQNNKIKLLSIVLIIFCNLIIKSSDADDKTTLEKFYDEIAERDKDFYHDCALAATSAALAAISLKASDLLDRDPRAQLFRRMAVGLVGLSVCTCVYSDFKRWQRL